MASSSSESSIDEQEAQKYCEECVNTIGKKVMRVIIKKNLVIVTVLISVQNGISTVSSPEITPHQDTWVLYPPPEAYFNYYYCAELQDDQISANSLSTRNYPGTETGLSACLHAILHSCGSQTGVHLHDNDIEAWELEILCQNDSFVLTSFLKNYAELLALPINEINCTLHNVLTTKDIVILDFDILKLSRLAGRKVSCVRSCSIIAFQRYRSNVVPFYTGSIESPYIFKEYFGCVHKIEQSAQSITWHIEPYFYNDDTISPDAYSRFQRNRKSVKNCRVKLGYNDVTKNHFVHILQRRFDDNSDQHADVLELLKIPFMKIEHEKPFIARQFRLEDEVHGFYIVYAINVNMTQENLFGVLILLRYALHRMRIGCIEMPIRQMCCNSNRVLEMIRFVFQDSDIEVLIPDMRNNCVYRFYTCARNCLNALTFSLRSIKVCFRWIWQKFRQRFLRSRERPACEQPPNRSFQTYV